MAFMSADTSGPAGKQNLESILADTKKVSAEIEKIRSQADEQFKATENYRKQVEEVFTSSKSIVDEISKIKNQADESLKSSDGARKKAEEQAVALTALLEEIRKIKAQSDEHLKAAESSRKKADDEATYASQAKNNTEAHAKAVATFKGQAEGDFNAISSYKLKSDELLQAITVKKTALDADAKIINDSKKAIEQATQSIVKAAEEGASRLIEVEESKVTVVAARKEIEILRDEVIQARNKSDAAQNQTDQFSVKANDLTLEISKKHEITTEKASEIEKLLTEAKINEEGLRKILDHLEKSDGIASGHEERVAKLSLDLESLIKKVEGLLPGATSAGLASAFNAQKKRFGDPQRRWLWAFVWCMVGLVAVSLPSFLHAAFGSTVSSWDELFRGLAMSLSPFSNH